MDKDYYMGLAINEAKKSLKTKDVPVGAVIVMNGKVIAKGHNKREKTNLATAHAEIFAINMANKKVKDFRLEGAELYVTLEPCLMCMGAILNARISKIYFGASDNRFGTSHLATQNNFNHKCEAENGIRKTECEDLLINFFRSIR